MAEDSKSLRLVPFNPIWVTNEKIDIHAIYRRPVYKEDEYGDRYRAVDKNGLPEWDLTGPLPVKSHTKWIAKGFQYVTLADYGSLLMAAEQHTILDKPLNDGGQPVNASVYNQGPQGPWNYRKYVHGTQESEGAAMLQLKADVETYGWEVVEKIRKGMDPAFVMPETFKRPQPKREKAVEMKVQ